ncbi:semaphorin-2A-like [Physella acuta]|uniref:semaphorin-2A-like n=1 Tax=Physella acuta TaxID=109671 RepID=UPI0027DE7EEB|nr:semaphorin-2A-like [Physella acuta]XP_059149832.1 semaphorin-2A-like [Physella acuta]
MAGGPTELNMVSSPVVRSLVLWSLMASLVTVTCMLMDGPGCDSVTKLYAEDLDLKLFQDGTSHPKYYRYLTIDLESNFLFVGAMNRIIGLYLKNIENKSKRINQEFKPLTKNIYTCKIHGKMETPECQNHIRYIVRNTSVPNTFYMCGTGAFHPTAYHLKLENDKFVQLNNQDLSGIGFCPYDPMDNTTVIFVEKGVPGNVPTLFAGAVTDFIKSDPIITRLSIYNPDGTLESNYVRTLRSRVDWLNEPQFVGSFEVGPYLYFFFREVALEYTNCGKKIYSRVARVCKNDYGGYSHLQNLWTSFMKARLNCSLPGEYPYYFDEIQDVYRVGDTFYGLFTTNVNGYTASAICGFTNTEIDKAFDGTFKEQSTAQSMWLPVSPGEIPTPRPGNCSALNKHTQLPYNFINFVSRLSMLMDKAVSQTFGRPIFYKADCLLYKLVVVNNIAGPRDLVFFTSTSTGVIYKIAAWASLTELDPHKTHIVTSYIPFNNDASSRLIWDLLLYNQWIYFGTDVAVGQLSVETCDKYKKIDLCLYDPYCGWDSQLGECRAKSNERRNLILYSHLDMLSYSLEESIRKLVGELYTAEKVFKISGSSATLRVDFKLHISGSVKWTKNGTGVSGDRHILAQDNSLIITDLRKSDEGTYVASDSLRRTVAEYTLAIETSKEQIEQRWMRKFDQWCDEFERYQEDVRQWERKCNSCCAETALTNRLPAIGGGK